MCKVYSYIFAEVGILRYARENTGKTCVSEMLDVAGQVLAELRYRWSTAATARDPATCFNYLMLM